MIKDHPHQNIYFNVIAGKEIENKFEMDYWGLSNKQAFEYILKNENNDKINVGSAGPISLENSKMILSKNNRNRINITENSQLKYLYLNFNSFYKLDTSGNPNLQDLSLDNNAIIPEFDFSNNSSMKNIAMPNIAFGALSGEYIGAGGYFDISHLTQLEGLSIHDNNFTSIDLSGNPNLTLLRASSNNFTSIDLSNNDNLIEIELGGGNTFPIIVTSNMENLEILSVGDNPNLTSLNVSSNTELIKLEAPSCNLQGILDVSMLENLMELRVLDNPNLTCIKVNQTQLDNINNGAPDFNWVFDWDVTISVDCD